MILNKFAYLYSKPLGNHTLKDIENTWKFTKNTWKYHGILSVRKSGNPECRFYFYCQVMAMLPLSDILGTLYENAGITFTIC